MNKINKIFQNKVIRMQNLYRKGFTLLELLLGLTLFSIIAVLIYSIFSSGIELSRRSENSDEVYQQARWSLSSMSGELENMVNYDFSNSYKDMLPFMGDDKKITFILASEDGLKVVSYYLADPNRDAVFKTFIGHTYKKNVSMITHYSQKANINYLVREERPFIDYLSSPSDHHSQIEVVAMNVKEGGLHFFYAYNEEGKNEVSWKNTWPLNYLPAGVRIDIEFVSLKESQNSVQFTKEVLIPKGILGTNKS